MSLRNLGRVLAASDTPPFLLRWSQDEQSVFYRDKLTVSLNDLRELATYFANEATEMYSKLMLGLNPDIDLTLIKDDIINTENNFSFITYPGNSLRQAYFTLSIETYTNRRHNFYKNRKLVWTIVIEYLKNENKFHELLLDTMYITSGQLL
jgi:hypothetical protein